MPGVRPSLLGLCLGLLLAGPANAQASFQGLGSLAGASAGSTARDISGNGAVVVGSCPAAATCTEAWRWTQAGGIAGIGFLPGEAVSSAVATSADGAVVFGTTETSIFRWTAGGMVDIGAGLPAGGPTVSIIPQDLSDDGLVGVGGFLDFDTFSGGSFRWTSGLGIEILIPFTLPDVASFRAVSADGAVIVGSSGIPDDPMPFYRTDGSGVVFLPELPAGDCQCGSEAIGVSADGQTIVGTSNQEAFRWSAAGGTVGLGFLEPPQFNDVDSALDVSADGSVIVGTSGRASGTKAFLWTEAQGMRELRVVLEQLGLDLTGWTLGRAEAVSDDGRWIAGNGINPSGDPEAWLARVPALPPVPGLPLPLGALLLAALGATGAASLALRRRPAGPARDGA